jgi:hypothetical protein
VLYVWEKNEPEYKSDRDNSFSGVNVITRQTWKDKTLMDLEAGVHTISRNLGDSSKF